MVIPALKRSSDSNVLSDGDETGKRELAELEIIAEKDRRTGPGSGRIVAASRVVSDLGFEVSRWISLRMEDLVLGVKSSPVESRRDGSYRLSVIR